MLEDAKRKKFDVLLVWKLDRLGRSLKDLVTTLDDLAAWGIDFFSYSDRHIDTTTPSGKLVFQVIGAVAEFERELIRERVRAGLENARRKGKRLGRKPFPPYIYERAKDLAAQGASNRAIAKDSGISEGAIRNRRKKENW
jgi:DNA invertase Pin-like site-specific DNA recombinase